MFMVQQSPALSSFIVVVALLVSVSASAEGPEPKAEHPAEKIIRPEPNVRIAQPEKHGGIAQKTAVDLSAAKPGLKHSDYRLREAADGKNSAASRLARTTPEAMLYDVDGMPVAPVGRQDGVQRTQTESISATAWAWALIPIGVGLVLFPLRRKYRRSTIRP